MCVVGLKKKHWEHLPWYLFSSDVFESHWDSNFVSFPVVTWAQCVLVLLNRLPFPLGFHGAYHGGLHGAVSKTYTICAWIFCVVPMGQAYVTYGATQGLPVLVYSESDFRLYTRIVLFAAGHDGLVSVTSNIVRKIDIFGVLSLTSYPMHLHCHLRHTHLKYFCNDSVNRLLRWDILLRGIFWLGVLSATWLSSSCMEVFHVTSRSTLFEPLFHIECGGLNSESICLDIYFLLMYSKVTEILTLFRFLSWRERMCTCTFELAVISAQLSWRFTAVGLHGAVLKTYTICALIFCVAPMGQARVTCGATQGLPALVYL